MIWSNTVLDFFLKKAICGYCSSCSVVAGVLQYSSSVMCYRGLKGVSHKYFLN